MKTEKKELDVDYIGGQGPLTPTEEKAISEFIRQRLQLASTKISRPAKSKKRTKVSA